MLATFICKDYIINAKIFDLIKSFGLDLVSHEDIVITDTKVNIYIIYLDHIVKK